MRDTIDRDYAEDVDLGTLAALAHVSPDHLVRAFRAVFGETPHRYLQRRRVERAMVLLRSGDDDVLTVCHTVGFTSVGTFGRLFTAIVGETPITHRARGPLPPVHGCFAMAWGRPASFDPPPRETPPRETSVSEKRPVDGAPLRGQHDALLHPPVRHLHPRPGPGPRRLRRGPRSREER